MRKFGIPFVIFVPIMSMLINPCQVQCELKAPNQNCKMPPIARQINAMSIANARPSASLPQALSRPNDSAK